jgi:hypothetical protein
MIVDLEPLDGRAEERIEFLGVHPQQHRKQGSGSLTRAIPKSKQLKLFNPTPSFT